MRATSPPSIPAIRRWLPLALAAALVLPALPSAALGDKHCVGQWRFTFPTPIREQVTQGLVRVERVDPCVGAVHGVDPFHRRQYLLGYTGSCDLLEISIFESTLHIYVSSAAVLQYTGWSPTGPRAHVSTIAGPFVPDGPRCDYTTGTGLFVQSAFVS